MWFQSTHFDRPTRREPGARPTVESRIETRKDDVSVESKFDESYMSTPTEYVNSRYI